MDNGKSKITAKKIKVYGIVQGVGFRPLVYRIAQKYQIKGNVRNVGGYVEITAQGTQKHFDQFLTEMKHSHNTGCEIVKLELEDIPCEDRTDFIIVRSQSSDRISIIPPDLPVCPDCQAELSKESDRRFQNPFISCMSCGPRYTIIEELPYDRQNTTMEDFQMCPSCLAEYTSPDSRRFHAQTISCDDCGPYLIFRGNFKIEKNKVVTNRRFEAEIELSNTQNDKFEYKKAVLQKEDYKSVNYNLDESELFNREAFDQAVDIIKQGGILAVKGIGGYHFACSPFLEETVSNLRSLKGREEKPFAVMFPSMEEIENYCMISKEEKALLETKARPIVLLSMRKEAMAPSTNRGSIYCGAFLPYTPLQMLLTTECGPLIMTSANRSGQPIIKEDADIISLQSPYLQGVLYNKRRIVRSVDDSVAKIIDGKPQLIRRSRGYVPYPVYLNEADGERTIFAAGGDLKAAFCLYQGGNAIVSQYFGDLEETKVMTEYQRSYEDLKRLLKINPSLAVCDLHPNYHSTRFVKELGMSFLQVQHHHAHIAAVMAEHDIRERVIGVAFDGTGYGTDGNIWGGEFLVCEGAEFIRSAQLRYTPMLGGDQSMRDAKKTAACYLIRNGLEDFVQDDRKEIIKSALEHKVNTVLTSSMGRLFDAVSSILNIGQENSYEGECAALLEKEAVLALRAGQKPEELAFAFSEKDEIIEIDPKPVLEVLCHLRGRKETGALALGFHYAVAEAILKISLRLRDDFHSNKVALSGGVFQNTVLTERTILLLKENKFEVFVNVAVPPNDGAISLGQTYIGLCKEEKNEER